MTIAQANNYDLILMDVQMPGMNGCDARAIRSLGVANLRIPFVAMTADVLKEELDLCKEAGMNGFIPKPFTRKELVDGIANSRH